MVKKKIIVSVLLLILTTHLFCEKCGQEGMGIREISGGYQSEPNQFPWMVFFSTFKDDWQYWCGGSLISNKHIITAKHCTTDIDHWGTARVGIHNSSLKSNDSHVVEFEKVFLHKTEDDNDIAIILLKKPVDLENPTIGTVCLPETEKKEYKGQSAKGMGWGMVDTNKFEDFLKVVDLEVDKMQEKNYLYTKLAKIKEVYQDPCAGDSGGPLVHKTGDQWTIIGTVYGNGYDCRSGKIFGLGKWNKVTAHLKWIKNIIKENNTETSKPREPGCLIEPDYNYPGYDLVAPVILADWKACRDSAKGVSHAHYWTFRFLDRACWLKSSNRNRAAVGKGIFISGNSGCKEGFHDKGSRLLHQQEHLRRNTGNYYKNIDYNKRKKDMVHKLLNKFIGITKRYTYGGNSYAGHIKEKNENSNNKENMYVGNYQGNENADNISMNGQIKSNLTKY